MTSIIQAKPYAKAVFEYANDHKVIAVWFDFLGLFSSFFSNDQMTELLMHPGLTHAQRGEVILDLFHAVNYKLSDEMRAFIFLLALNKRLSIVPDVFALFSTMKENLENTLVADVIAYEKPTETQELELISKLSKRFDRQVSINVSVDKTLLGGMVIKVDDYILDASVRRSLEKLASSLVA